MWHQWLSALWWQMNQGLTPPQVGMTKAAELSWKRTPRRGTPAGFTVGSILALAGPTNTPMLVLEWGLLFETGVLQVCAGCHSTALLLEHCLRSRLSK